MFGSTYVAVVTYFGDFAVVAPPSGAPGSTDEGSAGPSGYATGSGQGGEAVSGGSLSTQLIGALVFFALLAFIVIASVVRVLRHRERR